MHADGYAGFNGVFGEGKATEVACMAHIRRKFVDVFAAQGSAIAEEAIKRIAQLYGVEKQARGQSPEARAALRQENAKPIFDDLEEWLRDQLPKISGKSPLAKAIRYALGRMPVNERLKLTRFWRVFRIPCHGVSLDVQDIV